MSHTSATSEVRTYRVGPDFVPKGEERARRKLVPMFVILVAGCTLPIYFNRGSRTDPTLLFITLTIIALVMSFTVLRSAKKTRECIRKMADTFQLQMSDTGLTRQMADTPDMSVAYSDVTEAIEYPNRGLLLKTGRTLQTLEFPSTLERYTEAVDYLRHHIPVPIQVKTERSWNSPIFAVVIGLAGWVLFLNIQAQIPVLVLGTGLIALSGWGIWALTKSPNVSKASKRTRYVYVIAIVICIIRMLSVAGVLK